MCNGLRDIKDLTPVRGQDGKISDTQGKDFWSPTRLRRVGDQYNFFSLTNLTFRNYILERKLKTQI